MVASLPRVKIETELFKAETRRHLVAAQLLCLSHEKKHKRNGRGREYALIIEIPGTR